MNTRCPKCNTGYAIDPDALLKANCLAHCYRCGALFAVVDGHAAEIETDDIELMISAVRLDQRSEVSAPRPHVPVKPDTADAPAPPARPTSPVATPITPPPPEAPREPAEAPEVSLPFEVPDDLEPLEPSDEAMLRIEDTLQERRSHRGRIYALLALLLVAAIGLQLSWQYRIALLDRFPQLEMLCEHITCRPRSARLPDQMRVLQRDIQPTDNVSGSLTLSARMRNDADIAQPYPDIQLSLLDTNGGVLVRRRLSPAEYRFPPPPDGAVIEPGEVVTIAVDFKDPGYAATSFMIDFL